MSRLTKEEILKFHQTTYGRALGKTIASKVMNELLQYKDLEEQIGCPLEVVFKLLNQDYYYDELGHIWYLEFINLKNGATQFGAKGNVPQDLKNHKKTWWLRKDKSE